MKQIMANTNIIKVGGVITKGLTFSNEANGIAMYDFMVATKRLSGVPDIIVLSVSDQIVKSLGADIFEEGKQICVLGTIRTTNETVGTANKLIIKVLVKYLDEYTEDTNMAHVEGFITKQPKYRSTPRGREICDLLIASNRAYGESDYIPTIVWDAKAAEIKDCAVGAKLDMYGRLQSREYTKVLSDGTSETRIAYELSVFSTIQQ